MGYFIVGLIIVSVVGIGLLIEYYRHKHDYELSHTGYARGTVQHLIHGEYETNLFIEVYECKSDECDSGYAKAHYGSSTESLDYNYALSILGVINE